MKSELILMAKHLRSAASYVFMILLFLKTRVNSEGVPAGFPLARFVDLEVKTHQAVDASRTLFHRAPLTPTGCWHVLHLGGGLGSGERCPSPNGTPVLPRGCRTHLFFAVLSVFPTWCHLFLIGFFFFFQFLKLFISFSSEMADVSYHYIVYGFPSKSSENEPREGLSWLHLWGVLVSLVLVL